MRTRGLTDRERDVLALIARGYSNWEICVEEHISPQTVKNHVSNILRKLDVDNRTQAAVKFLKSDTPRLPK